MSTSHYALSIIDTNKYFEAVIYLSQNILVLIMYMLFIGTIV